MISVPGGITIQVQVKNLDRHPHSFELEGTLGVRMTVAPGKTGSSSVTGLGKGSYRLTVDGRTRAQLVIGSQPGP